PDGETREGGGFRLRSFTPSALMNRQMLAPQKNYIGLQMAASIFALIFKFAPSYSKASNSAIERPV
ncbi:MAG: hypothetical protein K2L00_09145, partial [Muribaculaceae bacterium]|nr:hypothetical protein [Muribaculaceae bacterium]